MWTLIFVIEGTPSRMRWISAGEVMRQSGHGQSAENDKRARYHEGGEVAAGDILEQP